MLKKMIESGILRLKEYTETEVKMLAAATDKQKDSLKEYMKKIKDIKLRVPEEYLEPIKEYAKSKGMSVNQLVISLLEKEMGIDIVTIREQNKQDKEESKE
jgi:predicted DNA binding CopG/RHH family protein